MSASTQERTRNYPIHGFLRHNRLKEARQELDLVTLADLDATSRAFRLYMYADLARREGRIWDHEDADNMQPRCWGIQHPWGLYFQATGRQPGRSKDDTRERLARSSAFFRAETPGYYEFTLSELLAAIVDICRCARENRDSFIDAVQAFSACLNASPENVLANYYRDAVLHSESEQRVTAADHLASLCPYF